MTLFRSDLLSVVAAVLPDTAVRDHLLVLAEFRGSTERSRCPVRVLRPAWLRPYRWPCSSQRQPRTSPTARSSRLQISLGGDADTIAAIGAQIAAVGGRPLPDDLVARLLELPQITPILNRFVSLLK